MKESKRILLIADINYNPVKMMLYEPNRFAKGFAKLDHHTSFFSYAMALKSLSPFKSKTITKKLYKKHADDLLVRYQLNYQPDIVLISFPRDLDYQSVIKMKNNWPNAVYIGYDVDPWPKLQKSPRLETAKALDIVTATNNGRYLDDYRNAGVQNCVFLPNSCDPDINKLYDVQNKWRTNILWTGKAKHKANSQETIREQIVNKLLDRNDAAVYGHDGKNQIGGMSYLYAISGAKIGVSINAVNDVRMYHSDRLINYLAGGTFVLAKRVPDSDLLFKDGLHLKYFDTVEEFFELADWYLQHEGERKKIANAGMQRAHDEFNCEKIAGYILELAENGTYKAPWM